MIIDIILNRQDANNENPPWECYGKMGLRDIYSYAKYFNKMDYLVKAIDDGDEEKVKEALCRYIDENEYNPAIKEYIKSKKWLVAKKVGNKWERAWEEGEGK